MRRPLVLLTSLIALTLVPVASASAESVTVAGSGPITELVAKNNDNAVLVKVFGDGGKSNVHELVVKLKDGDGTVYTAQAGWYGEDWIASLARGSSLVECGSFSITWNSDNEFWRVFVPRNCLNRLANRIKVKAEMASMINASPGLAGWTPWISRG